MTHLLVIKDAAGKELARVPVTAGYTTQEIRLPKEVTERKAPDASKDAGDDAKGQSRVG